MTENKSDDASGAKTFVHSSTRLCATKFFCIPCHYKAFPSGTFKQLLLPPNQRPEQCRRSKTFQYGGLYRPHHRLLTLGDGDFSFSLSIAKKVKFTSGCLVATSHESAQQLLTTYNSVGIKDILKELKERSITTLHGIDATNIAATGSIEKDYYDAIIWNFPCVRAENGADGQQSEIDVNRQLLHDFFSNVHLHLKPLTGQLHITHKTFEPFSWWEIAKIAEECGFDHSCSIVFDRCNYPGYVNRKVLDKKSFPLHDARTFVFMKKLIDSEKDISESGNVPVICTGGIYALDSDLVEMSSAQTQKEYAVSITKITEIAQNGGNEKKNRKSESVADSSFSSSKKRRKK